MYVFCFSSILLGRSYHYPILSSQPPCLPSSTSNPSPSPHSLTRSNLNLNLTVPPLYPAAGDYIPRSTDSGMNNTSAGGGEGTGRDYTSTSSTGGRGGGGGGQDSDYKTGNYPPEGDCTFFRSFVHPPHSPLPRYPLFWIMFFHPVKECELTTVE